MKYLMHITMHRCRLQPTYSQDAGCDRAVGSSRGAGSSRGVSSSIGCRLQLELMLSPADCGSCPSFKAITCMVLQ